MTENTKILELYMVHRKNYVRVVGTNDVLFFDHIDGMYSYCVDKHGNVCHIIATTKVEVVGGFDD